MDYGYGKKINNISMSFTQNRYSVIINRNERRENENLLRAENFYSPPNRRAGNRTNNDNKKIFFLRPDASDDFNANVSKNRMAEMIK